MEQLITQLGPSAAGLIAVVPLLVQQLKKLPVVVGLQKRGYPAYELLSLALGIAGAFAFGLPNPLFAGAIVGLAASGAYDNVKKPKNEGTEQ